MADGVEIKVVNIDAVMRAMRDAPLETEKSVRGVLRRGMKTFRNKVKDKRLSGPPGLNWSGKKRVGRNIRWDVTGDTLGDMRATISLSKFMMGHEEGRAVSGKDMIAIRMKPDLPIKPDRGNLFFIHSNGRLYLAQKIDGKVELLYLLMKSIQLKPKLGLRAAWVKYEPQLIGRINRAVVRSMQRAFETNFTNIAGSLAQVGE